MRKIYNFQFLSSKPSKISDYSFGYDELLKDCKYMAEISVPTQMIVFPLYVEETSVRRFSTSKKFVTNKFPSHWAQILIENTNRSATQAILYVGPKLTDPTFSIILTDGIRGTPFFLHGSTCTHKHTMPAQASLKNKSSSSLPSIYNEQNFQLNKGAAGAKQKKQKRRKNQKIKIKKGKAGHNSGRTYF